MLLIGIFIGLDWQRGILLIRRASIDVQDFQAAGLQLMCSSLDGILLIRVFNKASRGPYVCRHRGGTG